MRGLFVSSLTVRTLIVAAVAGAAMSVAANAQVRGVGDIKFEFNAPRRAGVVGVQFFDFSGSALIEMPRLNINIPFDGTKTADQNLVIKRDAIHDAVKNQFNNYVDADEPVIQAGVRATAFAKDNANANVGFRGFTMTNVPFDIQRNANNPNAIDRIFWGVTVNTGRTGEIFDKIINRPPPRVNALGGNCGHSKVSFQNPDFSPLSADGQPAQWHAGIIVDDNVIGATVGVSDLPQRMDGSPDTSGAAIAMALYLHLPSFISQYASVASPAGGDQLLFDFLELSSGVMNCGVSFGTTSDSEGVSGTYALPAPGSLVMMGAGMLLVGRRRR